MALVPFRVSGAAADQGAQERLFQIGADTILIRQRPAAAKAMRDHALRAVLQAAGQVETPADDTGEDLGHVGLVVWQSAFLLAELLTRAPPFGGWGDVRVVDLGTGTGAMRINEEDDFQKISYFLAELLTRSPPFGGWGDVRVAELGTGTGVVAIALARAGAEVVAADLPHITPLTRENVALNCGTSLHRCQVVDHAWGEDVGVLGRPPDIITGADVIYEEQHYPALLVTLQQLAAPHTLIFLASRLRGRREERFEGMLADADFAVERVSPLQLHEEYRDGEYRVLRAAKRDDGGGAAVAAGPSGGAGPSGAAAAISSECPQCY